MIAVLLSVAFGAAVALLYEGLTNPRPADAGTRRLRRLEEFLRRAGLHDVSPRDFLGFALGSGVLVGVGTQVLLGWPVVSALVGGLALVAPVAYFVRRHDHNRAAIQAALVEAIGQVRDAIRAGLSVPEALATLGESGPEALRPEFARLTREMRLAGLPAAVAEMQERLADPVFDVVAAALLLNDQLGGRNVSQLLDHLAQATRAELRVQQELQAYQARNVLSARIVAAVPLVVLVAIRQVNPVYLTLFSSFSGQLLLAACGISVALGYGGMVWLTRLPGDERVLRS